MAKILVYGFYGKNNIGDELFKDSFSLLFPNYQFTFTDKIIPQDLSSHSAIFIGGGSFLNIKPNIPQSITLPIFYIGVGPETDIHPEHIKLIKQAKLIAPRSFVNLDHIRSLNSNVLVIPDLVYALNFNSNLNLKNKKSVVIIPNIYVVPQNHDPYWKHAAWNYFKSEFSQFLDDLIDEKYSISFLPFCQNGKDNDKFAACEIISHMKYRDNYPIHTDFSTADIISLLSSSYIISQRFHGLILSEIAKSPYIAIHHHDKLKYNSPNASLISYYGIMRKPLLEQFHFLNKEYVSLPIESDIFETLKSKVFQFIGWL